ncbi:MAG TPA: endonuclease/exonuclease/phosphatase family protein [Dongiaceae bacterium]|nr:endonuclease/exonuclease/phosphatase family protein [Dongiaceae bacterium]
MDLCHLTIAGRKSAASFLRRLPWLCLLCVIASGCVGGRPSRVRIQAGRTCAARESQGSSPVSLKVTTFNVWGLPAWLNGASADRYGKISHDLARLGSDVVLLQEVWTRRSFEVLSEQANGASRTWWTADARRKGGLLGQNGLLTLSRFPIKGAWFRRFSASRLPDSLANKGALKVTLELGPGQRVTIWNVHLQDGTSGRVRSRQIAELIRWVEQAQDGQFADIVGGDFNFTPESSEFRRFAAAIGPSVPQLANEVALPTWDGLKSAPGAGQVIDHIFVRMRQPAADLRAGQHRVFTASRRADRLSDHMGVEAVVTFGGAEESGPAIPLLRTASSARLETPTLTRQ